MPYIHPERRLDLAVTCLPATEGELNYLLTSCVKQYLLQHEDSYSTFNAVVGALESAKQEFYRRKVVPLEQEKIQENGDVY